MVLWWNVTSATFDPKPLLWSIAPRCCKHGECIEEADVQFATLLAQQSPFEKMPSIEGLQILNDPEVHWLQNGGCVLCRKTRRIALSSLTSWCAVQLSTMRRMFFFSLQRTCGPVCESNPKICPLSPRNFRLLYSQQAASSCPLKQRGLFSYHQQPASLSAYCLRLYHHSYMLFTLRVLFLEVIVLSGSNLKYDAV